VAAPDQEGHEVSDRDYVGYERTEHDGVVLITLERPEKLNAISTTMMNQLAGAFRRFDESDAFVAVLTGSGRAFSAGMDVMENFAAGRTTMQAPDIGESFNPFWPGEDSEEDAPTFYRGKQRRLQKLVIAAVHGYAFGGGFLMALAADLCVAADDTVFEVSEVPRGLAAGWDLGYLNGMPRHVAMELALGLRMTGRRAYELGIVNRLVAKDDLITASLELAAQLCALPRATLIANRALLDSLVPIVPQSAADLAEAQRQRIAESPDAQAGFLGFVHKHSG
jgi:enoyl-CoA hydratase/carnithine racemase